MTGQVSRAGRAATAATTALVARAPADRAAAPVGVGMTGPGKASGGTTVRTGTVVAGPGGLAGMTVLGATTGVAGATGVAVIPAGIRTVARAGMIGAGGRRVPAATTALVARAPADRATTATATVVRSGTTAVAGADGPAATTVKLPRGTTVSDIEEIDAYRVVAGTEDGATLTLTDLDRVFFLRNNYLPRKSFGHWHNGDIELTSGSPHTVVWPTV